MKTYLDLLEDVVNNGSDREDRTGVGTRSVFGRQVRYDLSEGFPLLTTKRVYTKGVIAELLWFLRGDTNIKYLTENDCHIWDEWATAEGELGAVYGEVWRSWKCPDGSTVDQISDLIGLIKTKPHSRRLIVSGWNPAVLPDESVSPQENALQGKAALPPCHTLFQFYVQRGKLSCQLYQRSADLFLGVPFNIASYALLTHMVAQQCDLEVGEFIHTFGDLHLYKNHLTEDIVFEQLSRKPEPLPQLIIKRKPESIFDYAIDDFEFVGYNPQKPIKAPIAV